MAFFKKMEPFYREHHDSNNKWRQTPMVMTTNLTEHLRIWV
jgi:hypothetical protein